MKATRKLAAALALIFFAGTVAAQGTQVPFGGLQHDSSLPVEIAADSLIVDQSNGNAEFKGNVLIGQGEMRLSADEVLVEYKRGADGSAAAEISRLLAKGNVTLVNGPEAAEAEAAEYLLETSKVVMTGSVVLTQGQNALSAERMVVDLTTGNANLEGRVRTILQAGSDN